MKIGHPNHPRKDILKEISWIGENGFDFVDLFLEEDFAVPEKIDVKKTKALLDTYRLDVVGHTAWYLPIGSSVKSLRTAAVDEAVRYFKVFAQLNVRYVTIHGNWPSGMFSEKEGVDFQVDSLRDLVRLAKKYKISVMYEPINTEKDNVKNVSEILKRVPGLWLHVDIGHANLHGREPEEFILRFRDKIKHVHMHDNDGHSDLHIPMGCGRIDWSRLIRILKRHYDGTITLEIFSQDKDYVLLSKRKLERLWKQ